MLEVASLVETRIYSKSICKSISCTGPLPRGMRREKVMVMEDCAICASRLYNGYAYAQQGPRDEGVKVRRSAVYSLDLHPLHPSSFLASSHFPIYRSLLPQASRHWLEILESWWAKRNSRCGNLPLSHANTEGNQTMQCFNAYMSTGVALCANQSRQRDPSGSRNNMYSPPPSFFNFSQLYH